MRFTKSNIVAFFLGVVISSVVFMSVVYPWDRTLPQLNITTPQPPGPPPGEMHPMQPPSMMEEGGPYSAYPVSFPKVLGGFLFFEEHRPNLVVTKEQCEQMLPILDDMGKAWKEAMDVNEELKKLLTPEQEQYVVKHKSELEKVSTQMKVWDHLGRILGRRVDPGTGHAFAEFCRRRAASGPHNADYKRAKCEEIITVSDISSAFVFMEEDDPKIKLTPYQGAMMEPLFNRFDRYNGMVQGYFDRILRLTRSDQIEGVKRDIKEIIPYKRVIFETDTGTTQRGPLFDRVIKMCRQKLN